MVTRRILIATILTVALVLMIGVAHREEQTVKTAYFDALRGLITGNPRRACPSLSDRFVKAGVERLDPGPPTDSCPDYVHYVHDRGESTDMLVAATRARLLDIVIGDERAIVPLEPTTGCFAPADAQLVRHANGRWEFDGFVRTTRSAPRRACDE